MLSEIEQMLSHIQEIQQSRSRFQIEKFVIGQHDTPEMQFYQLCLELNTIINTTKRLELEAKKMKIVIDQKLSSEDELERIDGQLAMLGLEQTEVAIAANKRELDILSDIWSQFETKFSRKEIESGQEEYWVKRLTRQARAQVLGQGSVDMGHIEALSQAGILEPFIEEHSRGFGEVTQ